MNKLTSEQVEKLIDLIKENPVLFNKAEAFYKSFPVKEKIWKEIAKSVGSSESVCKIAWKSLRDQFVKANKELQGTTEGEATKKRKKYKHYGQLLFLKDSIEIKKTHDYPNLTDDVENSDSDVSNISNSANDESTFPNEESPFVECKPNVPSGLQDNSKEDLNCLQQFLTGMLTEIKSSNAPPRPRTDDELFFVFLANMVTKANLTPKQTRRVQQKVFNLVVDELDAIENKE